MTGPELIGLFEEGTLSFTGGRYHDQLFRYRLLRPERIEAGEKYPLVLFLHGAGERGDDNCAQLKYFPTRMATPEYRRGFPCFLVAPQCPSDVWWAKREDPAYGNGEPLQAVAAILAKVEAENPIDRERVYLTGLSMGGFGCWALAAQHPDWFAAVAPICGGGDPATAEALVDIPLWAVHGADDEVVLPARSRQMIEAVRAAGGHPQYNELPGVGHHSWTPAYEDPDGVVPWMFQQVNHRRNL